MDAPPSELGIACARPPNLGLLVRSVILRHRGLTAILLKARCASIPASQRKLIDGSRAICRAQEELSCSPGRTALAGFPGARRPANSTRRCHDSKTHPLLSWSCLYCGDAARLSILPSMP